MCVCVCAQACACAKTHTQVYKTVTSVILYTVMKWFLSLWEKHKCTCLRKYLGIKSIVYMGNSEYYSEQLRNLYASPGTEIKKT